MSPAPTVPRALQRRLDEFRQLSRMQAGSLITTVFGDAVLPRGGRLWLGSLIALLQPLGLSERLVRTAVFRLVKEEWLTTEAQGRRTDYMLTPAGRHRFDEAARQIYAASAPAWDQQWRLVLTVGDWDARLRERLRRALYWQGFGDLGGGAFVHPSADLGEALQALVPEGLSALRHELVPLMARRLPLAPAASDHDIVQRAWNLEALALAYQAFVHRYWPLQHELERCALETLDPAAAFQVRTLLIHDFRRLLLRDPELPDALLPAGWPGAAARSLCGALYRLLLPASERHLDDQLHLANGEVPCPGRRLQARFGLDQPPV